MLICIRNAHLNSSSYSLEHPPPHPEKTKQQTQVRDARKTHCITHFFSCFDYFNMIIVLKFTGMFQWLIQSCTCSIVFQRTAFQIKQQQQKQNKHTQTHTQHNTKPNKNKTNKKQTNLRYKLCLSSNSLSVGVGLSRGLDFFAFYKQCIANTCISLL